MLPMLVMTPELKYCQGRKPHKKKMGKFVILLLGIITVKTKVKTNIMHNGLSRLQKKPNALFL